MRTEITFTHTETDENSGEVLVRNARRVVGDDADFLPSILRELKFFIQSVGFTYVEAIFAEKTGGAEIRDGAA